MGSFKSGLKFLEKYLACFETKPRIVYCGLQEILFKVVVPLQRADRPSQITLKRSFLWGGIHLFLAFVSLVSILRARLKGIAVCHYMIDTQSGCNGYDKRSAYILKSLPSSSTINFLHINDGRKALKGAFKHSYPVYFESLIWWASLFIRKQNLAFREPAWSNILTQSETTLAKEVFTHHKARFQQSCVAISVITLLLRFISAKRFAFVDDGRHANELVLVCNQLGITTIGYMHNRFNEFHLGLGHFPFDTYLVWSSYYDYKIHSMLVGDLKPRTITIGHPAALDLPHIKNRNGPINVLWLGESNINQAELVPIINELLVQTDIQVVYRPKPGEKQEDLQGLNLPQRLLLDKSANLFQALTKHEISVTIGTHSTALIDCWLMGVPSVMLDSSYDYGAHLIEDQLVMASADRKSVVEEVRKAAGISEAERLSKRVRIWGNSSTLKTEVIEHELC